jgi:hypothetical protein
MIAFAIASPVGSVIGYPIGSGGFLPYPYPSTNDPIRLADRSFTVARRPAHPCGCCSRGSAQNRRIHTTRRTTREERP